MPRDQIEQNEIDYDQNGSIYMQPKSMFDNFDEEFRALDTDGLLHGEELLEDFECKRKEWGQE